MSSVWIKLYVSGMENLQRYNCVPIDPIHDRSKPAKQLLANNDHAKFDRTDSDATSGIGLEMAPNSNCSVSSESDKCSGTFQAYGLSNISCKLNTTTFHNGYAIKALIMYTR